MPWIACVIELYLLKRIDAISLGKYFSILKYENFSEYALYKLNENFTRFYASMDYPELARIFAAHIISNHTSKDSTFKDTPLSHTGQRSLL